MCEKFYLNLLTAMMIAVMSVGFVSCGDDDEGDDYASMIIGIWDGKSVFNGLNQGDVVLEITKGGDYKWTENGNTRSGKYTVTNTVTSGPNAGTVELQVTWESGVTSTVDFYGVSANSMLTGTYRFTRQGSNVDNGGNNGDNSGGNSSLVGKTFTKKEWEATSNGGYTEDNTQISFTSTTACTMRCWGKEVFVYSDGDTDTDTYDTGTMTGTYTITGNKVHVSCYSSKYSTTYNREETIVDGKLVGYN